MRDLTKRLRELADMKYQSHTAHAPAAMSQAADRIDALEECLLECLNKGSRWHPCDPVVVKARALLESHD